MKKSLFASILATLCFLLLTPAFASPIDPPKKSTDPSNFTVNTGPVDEIGNIVRSKAMTSEPALFILNQESQTITYTLRKPCRLHNNEFLTYVTATYGLESGASPISLTITTESNEGQQQLWVFPGNQSENKILGPGSYNTKNADFLVMQVNNELQKPESDLQQSTPSATNSQLSQQPKATARSGSKTSQR